MIRSDVMIRSSLVFHEDPQTTTVTSSLTNNLRITLDIANSLGIDSAMSALILRQAGAQTRRAIGGYGRIQRRTAAGVVQDTGKNPDVLKKGAKRDPELYVSRPCPGV